MLKEKITYHDLDGNEITEEFLFNLYESEVIELNFSRKGGLEKIANDAVKSNDMGELLQLFKEIILKSYGVRSEDGKRFIKRKEDTEAFEQSEAYSVLFTKMITDDKYAAKFIQGVYPKAAEAMNTKKVVPQDKLPKKSKISKLTAEEAEVVE